MNITYSRALFAILPLGTVLLAIATPAEARRCINGTVMAANGQCTSPSVAAAPKPAATPSSTYRSCPIDFAWNDQSRTCTPVKRCPYDSKTCRR